MQNNYDEMNLQNLHIQWQQFLNTQLSGQKIHIQSILYHNSQLFKFLQQQIYRHFKDHFLDKMKMPQQIFIKDYHYINNLIHSSQHSHVYRADHIHNINPTPILFKVYKKKDQWPKIVKELNYLWSLKSKPHIVQILQEDQVNHQIFIITEFCQKGSLASIIINKGPIHQNLAVKYTKQIIQGYKSIYQLKIIHRNLTPFNVFQNGSGIKIGDFSDSIGMGECKEASKKQQLVGNVRYQPPQVLQKCIFSVESDIYSLGAIFLFMLTGRPPFQGNNKTQILKNMNTHTLNNIIPQHISPQARQFLQKTLQPNPTKRIKIQSLISYQFYLKDSLAVPSLFRLDQLQEVVSFIHNQTKMNLHNNSDDIQSKEEECQQKSLFKMFDQSKNKISAIDIKISDDEELNRYYKGKQLSICIPNNIFGIKSPPVLSKKCSEFNITRQQKMGHLQLQQLRQTNSKDNSNANERSQWFTKISILTPQKQLLMQTYKHSSQQPINDYNEGPITPHGWSPMKRIIIRDSKNTQMVNMLISQIDMSRWLNRLSYKLNKIQKGKNSALYFCMIGLKNKLLKDILNLTHFDQSSRQLFLQSSEHTKLTDIVKLYIDKMPLKAKFDSYEQMNRLLVNKIRELFQEIMVSSRLIDATIMMLDYLVSLWQLCKLLKKNDIKLFYEKSSIGAILQSKEYEVTIGHLLCLYEKLKKFKLIVE